MVKCWIQIPKAALILGRVVQTKSWCDVLQIFFFGVIQLNAVR